MKLEWTLQEPCERSHTATLPPDVAAIYHPTHQHQLLHLATKGRTRPVTMSYASASIRLLRLAWEGKASEKGRVWRSCCCWSRILILSLAATSYPPHQYTYGPVAAARTHEERRGRVGGDEEGLWSSVGSSECDRVELERGKTGALAYRSHLPGEVGGPACELGGRGDGWRERGRSGARRSIHVQWTVSVRSGFAPRKDGIELVLVAVRRSGSSCEQGNERCKRCISIPPSNYDQGLPKLANDVPGVNCILLRPSVASAPDSTIDDPSPVDAGLIRSRTYYQEVVSNGLSPE